jgi:WD40 repeat protein
MNAPRLFLGCALALLLSAPTPAPAQPRLDADGRPLPAGALARLGTTKLRLRQPVGFLSFAGDRDRLLAGSDDGVTRVWDLKTGKDVWSLTVPREEPDRFRPYANPGAITLSADGKAVAWWADKHLKVFATATGKEIGSLARANMEADAEVTDFSAAKVLLSPDGRFVTVTEMGQHYPEERRKPRKVGVWNTGTGGLVRFIDLGAKNRLNAAALGADNVLVTLQEPTNILKDVNPDEKNDDKEDATKTLRFWDLATGKQVRAVAPAVEGITDLHLVPGGKALVATVPRKKGAVLLDAATGKELRLFEAGVVPLAWVQTSADGKRLLCSNSQGAWLWDVATGKELLKVPSSHWDWQKAASIDEVFRAARPALAPDGKTVAVAAGLGFRLWDVDTGKELTAADGHLDGVASVAFSAAGNRVLTAAAYGPMMLWDAQTGRPVRVFQFTWDPLREGPIRGTGTGPWKKLLVQGAFAPDGRTVAGLVMGQALQRWETATGQPLRWDNPPGLLTAFAFAPNGRHVLLAGADGGVQLVQAETGKLVRQLVAADRAGADRERKIRSALYPHLVTTAFARDGRVVFTAALHYDWENSGPFNFGTTLQGFEVMTGQQRFRSDAKFGKSQARPDRPLEMMTALFDVMILGLTVSPDGKYLAAATPMAVKLWDLTTGKEVRMFAGRGLAAPTATFTPDGKWLLAGKEDGSLRVWDVATGTVLADLPLHDAMITALAFSPDGKTLATGAADTTVLLWDWAALRQRVAAAPGKAADLKALWRVLGDGDGDQVRAVLAALEKTPGPTVAFFAEHVRPAPPAETKRVEQLVDDLGSKQFAVRAEATKQLEDLGELAAGAIYKRLAANPPLEVRRRLEVLRDKLEGAAPPTPLLRALRAVEVLERIGTPEARQLLEALAAGAAGHRLTTEAAASVQRLKQRADSP